VAVLSFVVVSFVFCRYDVQLVLCTVVGVVWLALLWKKVLNLQSIPRSKWAI
jgi:hypothetical protein